MHQRLIFCDECALKFMDENGYPNEIYLAMFGSQGRENEDLILVTSLVEDAHPFLAALPHAVRNCDGCKKPCFISGSSFWFLEGREKPTLQ